MKDENNLKDEKSLNNPTSPKNESLPNKDTSFLELNEDGDISPQTKLIFLKAQFRSDAQSTYGIFYVILEPISKTTSKVLQFDCLASRYRTLLTDVFPKEKYASLNWGQTNEAIQFLRRQKEYSEQLSRKFISGMEILFSSNKGLDEFYSFARDQKPRDMAYFLNYTFSKVLTDSVFEFTFFFESVLYSEFIRLNWYQKVLGMEAHEKLQKTYHDFQEKVLNLQSTIIDAKNLLLGARFVLNPPSGKFVDELKVGDSVCIRLNFKHKEQLQFVSNVLKVRQDSLDMVQGVVDSVQRSPLGEFFFIIKIDEGIYGKVTELASVKVKTKLGVKLPSPDEGIKKEIGPYERNLQFFQKLLLWLVVIIVVFLIFVLIDLLDA